VLEIGGEFEHDEAGLAMTTEPSPFDKHLQTGHLNADLKGRAVRGGAVTLGTQAGKFVLTTGSTMVLARLLTPNDYGLVGMVTAVIGFASVFKDLGLSSATIQKAEITHQQVSNLFWLNAVFGAAISLLVALLAPVVAWFYHEPRLTLIGLAMASLYLLGGLTTQHQAILQRQMRFVAVGVIDVIALVVGLSTGVGMALSGAGYWALVGMSLTQALTSLVGVWVVCGWRPGWPSRQSDVRGLVAFGSHITMVDFLAFLARNLDNILLGRWWGPQVLAMYAKAYQMLMMPLNQINSPIRGVALPSLCRLQDDPEQFRRFYLKALSLISLITLPLIMLFILFADEIVGLVLGPQWREVGGIFRWLGVAALPQPMMNTDGWLYVATGQTARMMRWTWVTASVTLLSFIIGLPWGAQGVAVSYMAVELLLAWPVMWVATRGSAVKVGDIFRVSGKFALVAALAMIPGVILKYGIGTRLSPWLLLAASGLAGAVVYAWLVIAVLKMKDYFLSTLVHFPWAQGFFKTKARNSST
jgi:PST family polysaccharide transporter